MKKFIVVAVLNCFFFATLYAQGPPRCDDIVTIQGKEFRCGGELFYPLATLYSFKVVFTPPAGASAWTGKYSALYLSRTQGYGPVKVYTGHDYRYEGDCIFDCTGNDSCRDQIKNDLRVMHDSMGFNTFRTTFGPGFRNQTAVHNLLFQGIFNVKNYPRADSVFRIKPDTTVDSGVISMFRFIDEILDIAYECKLKVLLDIAYDSMANDDHFPHYLEYLGLLAHHIDTSNLQRRQTLMAYNILEEAEYHNPSFSKNIVCGKVNDMYEAIRAYDSVHLISVGGLNVQDIKLWDPGVMKIDFWSPHFYPHHPAFEDGPGGNADAAVERIKCELYWLKDNCPMPWMVGETGFAATDDEIGKKDTAIPALNWHCGYLGYPKVHGELDIPLNGTIYSQKKYAEDILKMVRDCGGSGFTMWDFQENYLAYPFPPFNSPISENSWGLLRHGEASTGIATYHTYDPLNCPETIFKPAVDVFQHFLDSNGQPPPADPDSVVRPAGYYDLYNTDYNTVTGTVKDTSGNLVKDAVVWGFTDVWPYDPTRDYYMIYTFTDSLGEFEIKTPYNYSQGAFKEIKVSYPGAGTADTTSIDDQPYLTGADFNCFLYMNEISIDENISNMTVQSGDSSTIVGFNTLTTSEVYVDSGGTADLYARYEVHLMPGFESYPGSETHIYNAVTFPDCDFNFIKKVNSNVNNSEQAEQNEEKEIVLRFKITKETYSINVFPNPCKGEFSLSLNFDEKKYYMAEISDILGNRLQERKITGPFTKYDISSLGKGIYLLKVYTDDFIRIKKIINQ